LTGSTSVPENKQELCHVIHLQPTLKTIWKEPASSAEQYSRADKQSFARAAARMHGQTTNTRIMSLNNSVGGSEGSFLLKKKGSRCERCGYIKNQAALAFHHLDASTKSFPLDLRRCSNTSWETLLKEADKRRLLCLNCHAEIHNPDFST